MLNIYTKAKVVMATIVATLIVIFDYLYPPNLAHRYLFNFSGKKKKAKCVWGGGKIY